jgi:hypothetical protein
MGLTDEERSRLADVVELQPTKNKELQKRWEMDGGSEVHGYLEAHLKDYYYRDDNSLIRATADAADLVDVDPGVESEDGTPTAIRVPQLQAQVFEVVAGPDERSESVVSVLQKLREEFSADPDVEDVREGLQALRRKGVIKVVYRTVPTFKLTVDPDSVDIEVI